MQYGRFCVVLFRIGRTIHSYFLLPTRCCFVPFVRCENRARTAPSVIRRGGSGLTPSPSARSKKPEGRWTEPQQARPTEADMHALCVLVATQTTAALKACRHGDIFLPGDVARSCGIARRRGTGGVGCERRFHATR